MVVTGTATDRLTFPTRRSSDLTTVTAGQSFTKTWTVLNSGTTTWNSGYSLQYVSSTSTSFCSHNTVYVSGDRKSTRLNSSHQSSTYPAFCVTYRDTYKVVNGSGTTFSTSGLWVLFVVNATGTFLFSIVSQTSTYTLFPYTTLFRSKTWTVLNSGTTTWNSGYSLQYVSSTSTSFCSHNTVYVS